MLRYGQYPKWHIGCIESYDPNVLNLVLAAQAPSPMCAVLLRRCFLAASASFPLRSTPQAHTPRLHIHRQPLPSAAASSSSRARKRLASAAPSSSSSSRARKRPSSAAPSVGISAVTVCVGFCGVEQHVLAADGAEGGGDDGDAEVEDDEAAEEGEGHKEEKACRRTPARESDNTAPRETVTPQHFEESNRACDRQRMEVTAQRIDRHHTGTKP
eukprot:516840-Rhodomonas_salina.2